MAWHKTASTYKSDWLQASKSVIWRSRWVFFRDGLLIGLALGAVFSFISN